MIPIIPGTREQKVRPTSVHVSSPRRFTASCGAMNSAVCVFSFCWVLQRCMFILSPGRCACYRTFASGRQNAVGVSYVAAIYCVLFVVWFDCCWLALSDTMKTESEGTYLDDLTCLYLIFCIRLYTLARRRRSSTPVSSSWRSRTLRTQGTCPIRCPGGRATPPDLDAL